MWLGFDPFRPVQNHSRRGSLRRPFQYVYGVGLRLVASGYWSVSLCLRRLLCCGFSWVVLRLRPQTLPQPFCLGVEGPEDLIAERLCSRVCAANLWTVTKAVLRASEFSPLCVGAHVLGHKCRLAQHSPRGDFHQGHCQYELTWVANPAMFSGIGDWRIPSALLINWHTILEEDTVADNCKVSRFSGGRGHA